MDNHAKYFDPETLAQLRTLSLRGRHLVEGYTAGIHRSPQRGQSIEFSEHREYSPGDDVRRVDWKVYARSDRYYVKQYEDESNLASVLAIDTSESMTYRGSKSSLSKLEYAQLVTLCLAYALLDKRDTVALATFSDKIDQYLEPSNQGSRWNDMIPCLETAPIGVDTQLHRMLGELATKLTRRSIVFVISDYFDQMDHIVQGCRWLRHERHAVVLIQVLDRDELEFPFTRTNVFQGMENGSEMTCDATRIRRQYLQQLEAHQRDLQHFAVQHEIDFTTLVTDQSLAQTLPAFIARRQHGPTNSNAWWGNSRG